MFDDIKIEDLVLEATHPDHTDQRVRKIYGIGGMDSVDGHVVLFQNLAAVRRYLQSQAAHHAGDAGAPYARSQQAVARLQEQVAHGAADHATILAKHQSFLECSVIPLCTRQHLIEAIQVFDPGQ
ncbi:MAG TPA: hypothetical protein PLY75_09485 [Gammaproteobacteria bacterium]|nr:hypothetical protein [Gammaproteobacteria bacterium]HPQ25152.1 hypothetical protein [Gammaproteobacteria bacterium]